MEAIVFFILIIVFIGLMQDPKKAQESKSKKSKRNNDPYDYGDTKSTTSSSSSSSNSDYTYTNPSTGLPMTTGGTGGVDSSGTPYGT